MNDLESERQQHRRLAVQRLGLSADIQRSFTAEVAGAMHLHDVPALPFGGPVQALQDASGNPLFMVGLSPVAGADPVGGG